MMTEIRITSLNYDFVSGMWASELGIPMEDFKTAESKLYSESAPVLEEYCNVRVPVPVVKNMKFKELMPTDQMGRVFPLFTADVDREYLWDIVDRRKGSLQLYLERYHASQPGYQSFIPTNYLDFRNGIGFSPHLYADEIYDLQLNIIVDWLLTKYEDQIGERMIDIALDLECEYGVQELV